MSGISHEPKRALSTDSMDMQYLKNPENKQ